MTVDETAQALGVSRSTIYECVRDESLPALRFRRRIVISAAVINQLLGLADRSPGNVNRPPKAG